MKLLLPTNSKYIICCFVIQISIGTLMTTVDINDNNNKVKYLYK